MFAQGDILLEKQPPAVAEPAKKRKLEAVHPGGAAKEADAKKPRLLLQSLNDNPALIRAIDELRAIVAKVRPLLLAVGAVD